MKRIGKAGFVAAVLAAPTAAAAASETVTYSYDVLGRLVAVSATGTVNDGLGITTSYDSAGNRCGYGVTGADGTVGVAAPACSGPDDGGANQPPVAASDSGSMTRCLDETFAVLANDSDPDGDLPLTLVSVSGGGTKGMPFVSGTSILFSPNDITGTAVVSYVMRDSLGATDSATLTITIINGSCPDPQAIDGEASQPIEEDEEPPPPEAGEG